jgi:hypothetical protein
MITFYDPSFKQKIHQTDNNQIKREEFEKKLVEGLKRKGSIVFGSIANDHKSSSNFLISQK